MKKYGRRHKITKHHILPVSRRGSNDPSNIWFLPREKHDAWHRLFSDRTIREVISFLKAIADEKEMMKNAKYRVDAT